MKKLKLTWLIVFLIIILPKVTFADAPEISAGEKYFNILEGHYVLRDNVRVALNNHGVRAIVTADEARVNVLSQKCWADGNVKFVHDNVIFSCDKAYLQWQTKTADVIGKVAFLSAGVVSITAQSATFNWREKIADFYGRVQVNAKENLKLAENLELEQGIYAHVQFDVRQNKILLLEKNSNAPEISIPDTDISAG